MNEMILGGRYELQEKIGEGGMSEVYKARDNKLNRFVAVKILKKEFCDNDDIVEKFKNEAKAIATLSDNNIVNVLDVGTQEASNYIVMEYIKGKTLKEVIKQIGKMNYETAISIGIQIAKALDCAHRNKIIHRDVKPQNILVTEDGIMKVTDFGIAKSASSATITNTTTIMGSAHYLSPEQAKGSFIDCRTDLYSLGIVMYEMVTGTLPFEADSAVTIALKHIQEMAVEPKMINSRIPDSLNVLIMKAIEKDPNRRYQTAKEFINDLQKIKDNPNAVIDGVSDDTMQQTIVMPASAVTEQIKKQNNVHNKINDDNYDDEYYDDDDEYYDDDDDEFLSKKRNKLIMKIVLSVLGILILVGASVFAFNVFGSSSSAGKVVVPNIVGKDVSEAKSELENLNLVLIEADSEASDKPEGTVLKSNPTAGTKVKEKSEVRVVISTGKDSLKMPDLKEDTLEDAKKILKAKGLELDSNEIVYDYSDNIDKGCVISQKPAAETVVSKNQKVKLVISLGSNKKKDTTEYVSVDNVAGLIASDGQNKLGASNVNVAIEYVDTQNPQQDGIIISQSQSGKVVKGTTITLRVGRYNKQDDSINNNNNNSNSIDNSGNGTTSNSGNAGSVDSTNNGNTNTGDANSGNAGNATGGNNDTPAGPWEDPALNNQ